MTDVFVAAIGDSVMWGEGLANDDKFAAIVANRIQDALGSPQSFPLMLPHCGAKIHATLKEREEFLDTFPHLFGTEEQQKAFLRGDDGDLNNMPNEAPASGLHGEIDVGLPTIRSQIDSIPDDAARNIGVVLLNGGANDLDFSELLQTGGNFVAELDPLFKKFFNTFCRDLLARVGAKFPNAVIIVVSYYSGFSMSSDRDRMKEMFLELKDKKTVYAIATFFTLPIITDFAKGKIAKAVRTARATSEYGESRGLYWMRKAVVDLVDESVRKGRSAPPIIFAAPSFRPENCMFASKSFIHQEFEADELKDDARSIRRSNCPRIAALDALRSMVSLLVLPDFPVIPGQVRALNGMLDGPISLKEVLTLFAEDAGDLALRKTVLSLVKEEVSRIESTIIASIMHPNPAGAAHIADVIMRRWNSWRSLSVLEHVIKFLPPERRADPPQSLSVAALLRRFGLDPAMGLRACLAHAEPDVLGVDVHTSKESQERIAGDLFLDLGVAGRHRLLHLPREEISDVIVTGFSRHYGRDARDFFSIDVAGQMAIGDITRATIVVDVPENASDDKVEEVAWRPESVTFSIDGRDVFTRAFDPSPVVRFGGPLPLPFPN